MQHRHNSPLTPPWWLLLMEPDWWEDGAYPEWMEAYEPRMLTFIRVLEEEERNLLEGGDFAESVAGMSLESGAEKQSSKKGRAAISPAQRMRERWETRPWMVNFAARKTWCFDAIFWGYLDPAYFGPNEDVVFWLWLVLFSLVLLV